MRLDAFVLGLGIFTVAGAARAEGIFVTFKNDAGVVLGARVQGASFDATTVPVTLNGYIAKTSKWNPAHVEIDDFGKVLVPTLAALQGSTRMSMQVDFTKPDSRGVEQTYMTAQLSDVFVTQWQAQFGSTLTHKLDLAYAKVVYSNTATTNLPKVERAPLSKVAGTHVDDAVVEGIVIGTLPHLTAATLVAMRPFDANTGMSGQLRVKSIAATRAPSTSVPVFKSITAIDFQQKSPAAMLFTVLLENGTVATSGESMTIGFQRMKLVDKTTGADANLTTFVAY